MTEYEIMYNANTALTVQFKREISEEVNSLVTSLCDIIEKKHIKGVIELLPTFAALTIYYDCNVVSAKKLCQLVQKCIAKIGSSEKSTHTLYHIPVCYDESFGEDMENVCVHTGLTRDEVIELHTGSSYLIYMLGFLPGFAYLGGMDERLFTPRLSIPRTSIPSGAVGIGGEQTGIYPVESPGGWQLIGRTPVSVYDKNDNSILYNAGDYIKFFSISVDEFYKIEEEIKNGTYRIRCEEVTV